MAQLKRKVTLRQKSVANNEATPTPPSSKKPWWPWVLGAVVVCGGLVFLLTRGNNTMGDEMAQSSGQVTEKVTSQDNPATTSEPTVFDTSTSTEEQPYAQEETPQAATPQKASEKSAAQQQVQDASSSQQKTAQKSESLGSTSTTTQDNTTTSRSVSPTTANGSVEEEAWRTIRGDYGNGADRKEALGSRYDEIQAKVNEFYREGKVH